LNELRLQFAEQLARYGDISCAFNSHRVRGHPPLRARPDRMGPTAHRQGACDGVHRVRQASEGWRTESTSTLDRSAFHGLAGLQPSHRSPALDISSRDVVAEIRKRFPDFAPCAYLNGTEKGRFIEMVADHAGRPIRPHPGLRRPALHGAGAGTAPSAPRPIHGLLAAFDAGGAGAPLHGGVRLRPRHEAGGATLDARRAGPPLATGGGWHVQSIMVIQPIDILESGAMNMCDACPDITVHEDELVWSCRWRSA